MRPAGVIGCMRELGSIAGRLGEHAAVGRRRGHPADLGRDTRLDLGEGSGGARGDVGAGRAQTQRRAPRADSIGLQHRGGPKARFTLADAGTPIPAGWKLLSDHPKRGLVIELPDGVAPEEIVQWLVTAARVLSPMELPHRWVAAVHRR